MAAGFDLARARRDTPATDVLIHLNNAGAALPPHQVVETVKDYLDFEERTGGYEAAAIRAVELEAVYKDLAAFLGAGPEEIALVDSATRAWNMALEAAVHAFSIGEGSRVLTGVAEYSSNHIALVQHARRYGFELEVIPDDEYGQISLEALANRLDSDVGLIALTHIPTNGGLIN
ncbi:MAG: aminotransferase class V-fold PLP-dependent enzyme, partial [Alphaproteobacteria bacterium]|nr:aminotransferase class V-fold PLP-dependent enzyme [Alphaproteobacteria bacterium]